MNTQIANGKCFINNKPLVDKYSISLVKDTNESISYRFTVIQDGEVIFTCPYELIVIDNRDPLLLVINAPNFYGEFSTDNTVDSSYSNLINSISLLGNLTISDYEITRPANTTTYTAKDIIGNVIEFSNALKYVNGNGYITKVRLMGDVSTQTFKAKLHLYSSSPSGIVDNNPFTLLYSNNYSRLGSIDLQALSTEGTGSTACATIWTAGKADVNGFAQGILPIKGDGGTNTIFGVLETLDAFTPTSGGKYFIQIIVDNI